MGQIQSLEDLLNFLQRRKVLILAVALVGVLLSALIAKSRPDSYEATAAIQVQGAQVGAEAVPGAAAQLLQSIEQRLTTREALLKVIERHGLYADLPALSADEKIALLRASVSFQGVAAAGNAAYGAPAQISAIIILARDANPEKAARLANDFAQGLLDLSAQGKLAQVQDTVAFYREETARITARITDLEAEIAAYKNTNAAALPEVNTGRPDELAAIEDDLRRLDQALVALLEEQRQLAARTDLRETERRRLRELESDLAVATEQKAALEALRAEVGAALARIPDVERGLAGLQRDLDQLQTSLAAATARLADAETEERLALRQQGERFALLDRAVTPENPIGSSGRKLFAVGALASLAVALVLAFALDLLTPVVRTSAQMERQLGLRPVIAIPELDLPGRPAKHGGKGATVPRPVLAAGALTLVLVAAAAFS